MLYSISNRSLTLVDRILQSFKLVKCFLRFLWKYCGKRCGKQVKLLTNRTIIHADLNNFYASVELLHHPKLRGHPIAVGGSVEQRHGIILARNYEARPFGIKVGEALWEARQKCPNLIIVPPNFDRYMRFSRMFRNILSDYSPQVESFGIWVSPFLSAIRAGKVDLSVLP